MTIFYRAPSPKNRSEVFAYFTAYSYICINNIQPMDKRLQQFLDAENITPSQLADTLGVTRAAVSHILSGRNRPGFEFLEAIALHFPQISMDWLLTGNGRMYKNQGVSTISDPAPKHPPRRVSKILVFYDDNSFDEFQ